MKQRHHLRSHGVLDKPANHRSAAIVESSQDAVTSTNLAGLIVTWNPGAEQLFGYTAAEAIGHPLRMLLPTERSAEDACMLRRIRQGEHIKHYETVRLCKDGTRRDVSLTVSPVKDDAGTIIGASQIARDITERKQNEARQRQAKDELEEQVVCSAANLAVAQAELDAETVARHQLAQEVTHVCEREQRNLGQTLHDDVAQDLIGVAYQLSVLGPRVAAASPPTATKLKQLGALLNRTAEKTKQLAKEWYPAELERHGLRTGLRDMCVTTKELFRLRCRLRFGSGVPELPAEVAVQFFRIAQEAVHNAAKHAHAHTVQITLVRRGDSVVLRIKDDGQGLPANYEQTGGLGQKIMRSRAETIGATLDVRNAETGGVVVSCTLPLVKLHEPHPADAG